MKRSRLLFLFGSGVFLSLVSVSSANSEYQEWLRKTQETYQEYKDKRDKEFTGFLQKQWKEMYVQQGFVSDKTPKPVKIPKVKKQAKKIQETKKKPVIVKVPKFKPQPVQKPIEIATITPIVKPLPVKPVISKPAEKITQKPTIPDTKQKQVVSTPERIPVPRPVQKPKKIQLPKGKPVSISYFGLNIQFSYDPKMEQRIYGRVTKDTISKFWSTLSQSDYELLQKQFDSKRAPLDLNDWSYAILVNKVAEKIYPGQSDAQSMFTWYFMTKAGYSARIAYNDGGVYLLLPSKQKVFRAPYFTYDGVKYYSLKFDGQKSPALKNLYTYDGHYPGAKSRMDMQIKKPLVTGRQDVKKTLKFKYRGKSYQVRTSYDKSMVDYLDTYPLLDLDLYLSTSVSEATANPLLSQLGKIINGKSEEEAVNILLSFTQAAFKYKNDTEHFGGENYLFPEETLHYAYSDCEDRVFMFAWLVRQLVGLEVVGLKYPGHLSAAVRFNEKVAGSSIKFHGKRYFIADPTYTNARAGQSLPDYKKVSPTVVSVSG